MIILMTGGTGFVGKNIAKELVRRGHQLRVLTRNPVRARMTAPFPAEFFAWDGEKQKVPAEALQGVEAVIHLAGESIADGRWSPERKKRLEDSRILATRNLVESLKENSVTPEVYVGTSAIGFYGYSGSADLDESSPSGNDFVAQLCKEWEAESDKLKMTSPPTRRVIFRVGVVLGQGEGFLGKLVPLFKSHLGARLGSGNQWISWIQIEDLVKLYVSAVEDSNYAGVYNATAPEPIMNAEMTYLLAEHLKVGLLPPVPSVVLKTVYGEMADLLLKGARVRSERLQSLNFQWTCPDFQEGLEKSLPKLKPGEEQLVFEQWIPRTRSEIFPYFESAENLEEITPSWLNFKVLEQSTDRMQPGTEIRYKLSLRGMPLRWTSKIETWKPDECFSDEQIRGPYARWHHLHEFESLGKGTLLRDRITFKLPMGWLGRLTAGFYVRGDIERIFAYRQKVIFDKFGKPVLQ